MPFRQPPKGGEGNAPNDYGVGFAVRDGTVSLVAHYTTERRQAHTTPPLPPGVVLTYFMPIAPIVCKRAEFV